MLVWALLILNEAPRLGPLLIELASSRSRMTSKKPHVDKMPIWLSFVLNNLHVLGQNWPRAGSVSFFWCHMGVHGGGLGSPYPQKSCVPKMLQMHPHSGILVAFSLPLLKFSNVCKVAAVYIFIFLGKSLFEHNGTVKFPCDGLKNTNTNNDLYDYVYGIQIVETPKKL